MPYFGLKPEYRTFCWPWWKQYLNPKTYYRAAKYFIQRGLRGWADCDTWSLDDYLNEVLPRAICRIKNYTHSHPADLTVYEWNKILTEIQVGFFAAREINNAEYETVAQLEDLLKTRDNGLRLFAKWYGNLWD